jgi:hypothetical protein
MIKHLIKELLKTKVALTGTLIGLLPGKCQERAGTLRLRIIEAVHEAMGEILQDTNPVETEKEKPTRIPIQ